MLDLGTDPESGETVRMRIGRFGPFVQVGEGGPGRTASLPEDVAPADLTVEKAMELVRAKAEGPRTLGVDPATGQNVYVMNGRYRRVRSAGRDSRSARARDQVRSRSARRSRRHDRFHGDAGRGAQAALACRASSACTRTTTNRSSTNFGRFGPYVKHGDEFRSLESEDDVFKISFDAALALLRAPKQSRRRPAAQKKVLRELTAGRHDAQSARRTLRSRTSPTARRTPRFRRPRPEALTYAQATELLAARRDAAPSPRRGRARPRAVKATAAGRPRVRP